MILEALAGAVYGLTIAVGIGAHVTWRDEMIDYSTLPNHIRAGFKSYIEDRHLPGDFITACLENSLSGAFGLADEVNRERLFDIVSFLYNEAPSTSWGSREKVRAWSEGESA